jgi:hypothetical protein
MLDILHETMRRDGSPRGPRARIAGSGGRAGANGEDTLIPCEVVERTWGSRHMTQGGTKVAPVQSSSGRCPGLEKMHC